MWCLMSHRYAPRTKNTRLGLPNAITSFDFSGNLRHVLERLEEFEGLIQEYDDLAAPDELQDDIKVGTVIKAVPEPIKSHFELNIHLYK